MPRATRATPTCHLHVNLETVCLPRLSTAQTRVHHLIIYIWIFGLFYLSLEASGIGDATRNSRMNLYKIFVLCLLTRPSSHPPFDNLQSGTWDPML